MTYKFTAVNAVIPLGELIDISIFHPLGDKSKPVFIHCHSKEWQDVGMLEVFPGNTLSTESLWSTHSDTFTTVPFEDSH